MFQKCLVSLVAVAVVVALALALVLLAVTSSRVAVYAYERLVFTFSNIVNFLIHGKEKYL